MIGIVVVNYAAVMHNYDSLDYAIEILSWYRVSVYMLLIFMFYFTHYNDMYIRLLRAPT